MIQLNLLISKALQKELNGQVLRFLVSKNELPS